jgi:hypothetical protein
LGLDHEKLTYRYSGREMRLTHVRAKAVKDIIAGREGTEASTGDGTNPCRVVRTQSGERARIAVLT